MEGYEDEAIKQTHLSSESEGLPRIHTVFTNLKRVISGVHSYVSDFKVQAYLYLLQVQHRFWPTGGWRRR